MRLRVEHGGEPFKWIGVGWMDATAGWEGGMRDGDFAIAKYAPDGSLFEAGDYNLRNVLVGAPREDHQQDLLKVGGKFGLSFNEFFFLRALDTGDDLDDVVIDGAKSQTFVFAGGRGPVFGYHQDTRTALTIDFVTGEVHEAEPSTDAGEPEHDHDHDHADHQH
jgi:hypothetical protein